MSTANIRPLGYNWEWSFSIDSGDPVVLTADEWKRFLAFINSARENVGNTTVTFDMSNISKGKRFTYTMFNAARSAISTATGHGTLPDAASQYGRIMGEAHFGRARDSINKVANLEILED